MIILKHITEMLKGVPEGCVLEIMGRNIVSFCDELLQNTKTYTANWREALNRDVMKKLGKERESK